MRRQIILSLIIIFIFSISVQAETLTGVVLSEKDKTPLPNASVKIVETGKSVMTAENGNFKINNVALSATIIVSHIRYVAFKSDKLNSEKENTILLKISYTVLDSYVVTANRYQKEAYKVSQPITAVSSEEIINKGHTIVSDVIRFFPGVDMSDAGPFRTCPVIRGLFGTRILVLVDGERLNDQRDLSEFAGVSMSLVDVNEIERIEVVN